MKKIILLLFLVTTTIVSAQRGDRYEKVKAYKTAYLTEELELSQEEAEKFWPIYNKHEAVMRSLRKEERRNIIGKLKDGIDNLSETEANSLIELSIDIKTRELKSIQKLYNDLKGVISSKKIIKLKKAEEDFKKKLLEQFRKRRKGK